jgi:hypothetical protein
MNVSDHAVGMGIVEPLVLPPEYIGYDEDFEDGDD